MGAEAYRFLWLPVYGPALVVSMVRDDDMWILEGIEYLKPDPRAFSGWRVSERKRRDVGSGQAAQVIAKLDQTPFWTRSYYRTTESSDGAVATIERHDGHRYLAVTHNNFRDSAFDAAARGLLSLAGLPIPDALRVNRND